MSTFASLILQTITLFSVVAAITCVWYSFRNLMATARVQQSRLDTLAERVRVLELKLHLGTDQVLVGSASQLKYASPERFSGSGILDTYRSIRGDGTTGEVRTSLFAMGQQPNRL